MPYLMFWQKCLLGKTATAQHDEEEPEDVAEFLRNPENETCFISREERGEVD